MAPSVFAGTAATFHQALPQQQENTGEPQRQPGNFLPGKSIVRGHEM